MRYYSMLIVGVIMSSVVMLCENSNAQNVTLQILLEIKDSEIKNSSYNDLSKNDNANQNTYQGLSLDKYNEKSKDTLLNQNSGGITDADLKLQIEENTNKYQEFSRKQSEKIKEQVKDYLSKKNYKVVDKNGEVTIILRTPYMMFSSIGGYYFDSVEYEASGERIFSGNFSQENNHRDANFIAKFIAKDIYNKLEKGSR